jgi:predicted TIM-barrel fold metal-dependent hydrolase
VADALPVETSMRIIDAHQHVCWHKRDAAGLIADMDEHGVDKAWLLTWEVPPGQNEPASNPAFNPEWFRPDGTHAGITLTDGIRARDRYGDRFILGYCPDPAWDIAPRLFEAAYYMHGVRVVGEWKFRMLLDDPRCLNLFRKAGELHCPVVIHIDIPYVWKDNEWFYYSSWYGGTVDNLARALAACPETIFIGHAPGFWREISGDAFKDPAGYPRGPVKPGGKLHDLFEKYPNLWADLSSESGRNSLARDPEHAKKWLVKHQDRLLFGRDLYGGKLQEFLATIEKDLPQEVWRKIYYENALQLVPDKA